MASIIERRNKEGKITSYGFSISNYPFKAIREGGFKKKVEAEAAAKYAEEQLNILKQNRKHIKSKRSPKPFYFEFEQWILKKKNNVEEKTQQAFLTTKKKIQNYFGEKLLIKITSDDYQDFMNSFKNLTVATNEKMNKHIREFVKYKFDNNFIALNFTTDVDVIGKDSPYRKEFLDTHEYNRFAGYLFSSKENLYYKTMILASLLTGVRFGELCAIRWDDIDFTNRTVHIHQQWDYIRGSGYKNLKDSLGKKSKKEEIHARYIPLNDQLVEVLLEFKASNNYIHNKDGRLFYRNNTAKVISNNSFNKNLEKQLSSLQIDRITSHGLRHSFATNLIPLGANQEYRQYLMGHKDYRTTERYYTHLHDKMFDEQKKLLNICFN